MDKFGLIFYAAIGLVMGIIVPMQAIINSKLAQEIGHPYGAAFVSFAGGILVFTLINLVHGFPSVKSLVSVPWYLHMGGIVGSVFIISGIFLVPKLGSSAWVALVVCGQLIMSVTLDHFGAIGLPLHPINLLRMVGVGMLISGTYLVVRF